MSVHRDEIEAVLTTLYRAISQAELDDVTTFGGFRGAPDGRSMETKMFATSAEDAAQFGRDLYGIDKQPFIIVEASVPQSMVARADNFIADGRLVVGVGPNLLPVFNAVVDARVLVSIPLGRR